MIIRAFARPPGLYWVITAFAVLAALFAVIAWIMSLLMGAEEFQRQAGFRPNSIFHATLGVAVLAEVIGVGGLLLRKSWAVPAFVVSLVATVLFYGYLLFILTAQGSLAGPIGIVLVHILLCWFAIYAKGRGWIGRRLDPSH